MLNGHLQEVNWYKERYRSWFFGDYVLGDGSLYLCTPVDPLLLALPLLEASRKQVRDKATLQSGLFFCIPCSLYMQSVMTCGLEWIRTDRIVHYS